MQLDEYRGYGHYEQGMVAGGQADSRKAEDWQDRWKIQLVQSQ